MFLGSVPTEVIQQYFKVIDFSQWKEVYVCCSGGFRIDRALLQRWPGITVRSNDVSLFSSGVASLATGKEFDIAFVKDLEWVEDELRDMVGGATFLKRVAAVMVTFEMGQHATGSRNRYKDAHLRHFHAHFKEFVQAAAVKVDNVAKQLKIKEFAMIDWRKHAATAMERGCGIAAFPPTYKAGYEKQFKFLNDNIEWPSPDYDIFDPKMLKGIMDEIRGSGVPYCVFADQILDGHDIIGEFNSGRQLPVYCYASTNHTSYRAFAVEGTAFRYKAVDPAKLTAKTKVTIVECKGDKLNFLKNIYLKKTIQHSSGRYNFLVYLDDMLAGAFIYDLPKFGDHSSLYLLSDFSVTRDAKISKLIAKLSLSRQIVNIIEKRLINRINTINTTAFTKNPVSMKYRGVMEISGRNEKNGESWVQYTGKVLDQTPQQLYAWWFEKTGKKAIDDFKAGRARKTSSEEALP